MWLTILWIRHRRPLPKLDRSCYEANWDAFTAQIPYHFSYNQTVGRVILSSDGVMEVCLPLSMPLSIFSFPFRDYSISRKSSTSASWIRWLWAYTRALSQRYALDSHLINAGTRSNRHPDIQRQMAQQILTQFQEHPDAWTRVPDILERSSYPQSKVVSTVTQCRSDLINWTCFKYIGLQILEKLIVTRWKTLPDGQRQGGSELT